MIPRVCHLIWLGPPLPEHLRELVDGFAALHPRWKLRWWTEAEIDDFGLVNRDAYDRAEELVPAHSVHQFRSDVARYEILYRLGGMYADCDYRWQKKVDPLLRKQSLVTCWEVEGQFVANGWIAAKKHHPGLAEAIEEVPERIRHRKDWWGANRFTGPHLWTPIAMRHARILPAAAMHPVPYTNPALAEQNSYPDSTAVHLWNHQRAVRGIS